MISSIQRSLSFMSLALRNTLIPTTDPAAGLKITEIFYSLQGEANEAGAPTVFIRLTGCPLRCGYCDTTYSFEGGTRMSLSDILSTVQRYHAKYVCVTGGEPLAQPNCLILLDELIDAGYDVSLETSGAIAIDQVNAQVSRIVDVKTPASKEHHRNRIENYAVLNQHDQVKFVICDRADYEWSKQFLFDYGLPERVSKVWFSPAFDLDPSGQLPALAHHLAEWILEDRLPVRLQLQLHKLLWRDAQGR